MIVPERDLFHWDVDWTVRHGETRHGCIGHDVEASQSKPKHPIGFRKTPEVDESWRLYADYV